MIGKNSFSFKCFCKTQIDIFPAEEFKNHIWACIDFQNKSPLSKVINGFHLDRLSDEELNMLKCELEIKLDEIKQRLEDKKSKKLSLFNVS